MMWIISSRQINLSRLSWSSLLLSGSCCPTVLPFTQQARVEVSSIIRGLNIDWAPLIAALTRSARRSNLSPSF